MRRIIAIATLAAALPASAAELSYNRDIRPILSDKCFFCHGPDAHERKGDLRLDIREDAIEAGAITPGSLADSEVITRINHADPDELMPPPKSHKVLTPTERELISQWIAQGAVYEPYWAYVPPVRHPVPAVENKAWPTNWIDHFILSRLEQENLAPAEDADPVTLNRRLHFDLNGLPPDPDSDTPPDLVAKLLSRPAFGEQIAAYWLDLVRYADTVGYHGDQVQNIAPYRDYIINAFNSNTPFDQFTREQLAGDLLDNPSLDQKVATGYNRLLQTTHEGGLQPAEYRAIYAADRVRNVSSVWMGATVGCAQCHDHKFDPFTMRDFYAMSAFFADIDDEAHFKNGTNANPTRREPELEVPSSTQRQQIADLEKQLSQNRDDGALKKRIAQIKSQVPRTMITAATTPRTVRILPRGNWLDETGEVVEPAFPPFLPKPSNNGSRATRLDLANWLTGGDDSIGSLTARVFVNRLWYLYFGTGLSRSLDDFGGQGQPPQVYPELLDNLAVEFVESGWDVKHMVALITNSHTYRLSSKPTTEHLEKDPENQFFARQNRYRLPAESIRDIALAVSGLLVDGTGGDSVKPYQPAGYYRHLNFPQRKYAHDTDTRQWRRGVYVHWQRQFLHPMLRAFDAPSREECTAERPRSNTPTAAMVLLNDPTFVEAARVMAERVLRHGKGNGKANIEYAYQLALSRSPNDLEKEIIRDLIRKHLVEYRATPEAARQVISVGQAPVADDLDPVSLATWTAICRTLLNLDETITRY